MVAATGLPHRAPRAGSAWTSVTYLAVARVWPAGQATSSSTLSSLSSQPAARPAGITRGFTTKKGTTHEHHSPSLHEAKK